MMMKQQMLSFPEWSLRTHVEVWLKSVAKEAGEHCESAMAEFGCSAPDANGDIDVSHLSDADIDAIIAATIEC